MDAPTYRRFMTHVLIDDPDGCWVWTGAHDSSGYGNAYVDGRMRGSHRVSYEHHVGPIPDGLVLDHLCRNRSCVNPDHLEPVTHRENILRGEGVAAQKARATHCPKGHPYGDDPKRQHGGYRRCAECYRVYQREWKRARRAERRAG